MTDEERRAMAIWQLREWGVHPTWITYWLDNPRGEGLRWVEHAIKSHQDALENHPDLDIAHHFLVSRE